MKPYSPELVAEIRRLYSEEKLGMTTIARRLGLSKTGVSYHLRDLIPTRPNRIYATREEAIQAKTQRNRLRRATDKPASASLPTAKPPSKPKKPTPVAQRESSGLISRRSEVRVLPGAPPKTMPVEDSTRLEERPDTALRQAQDTTCPHHWVCEPPNGPTSQGVCRFCGDTRTFTNSFDQEGLVIPTIQPDRLGDLSPANWAALGRAKAGKGGKAKSRQKRGR